MILQHNLTAMNTQRQLGINTKQQAACTYKLSSGYQINSAADNAAGLAISEKMRSQIRGLEKATRNIEDGISFVQTADGALNEVSNMLQRIRELSVQSSNDTNTDDDRRSLDLEVQQLKEEMTSIFKNTEFNKQKIWDINPTHKVPIATEKVEAVTVQSSATPSPRILTNDNKASIPSNNKYSLTATEKGITVSWDAYNGTTYKSEVIPWPDDLSGSHSFSLKDYLNTDSNRELAGIDFTYKYTVAEYASLNDVILSLNNTDVTCYPSTSQSFSAYQSDGNPVNGISFSVAIDYPALLQSGKDFNNYDDSFIESIYGYNNLVGSPTETSPNSKWDFSFEMKNIDTIHAVSTSGYYYSNWQDPNKLWWDYGYSGKPSYKTFSLSPNDGTLTSVLHALTSSQNLIKHSETGGTIKLSFDLAAASPYIYNDIEYTKVGSVTMTINVSETDTVDDIIKRLASISGADIDAGTASTNKASSSTYSNTASDHKVTFDSPIFKYQNSVHIQAGANSGQSIMMAYDSLNLFQLGIKDTSVTSREGAQNAVGQVDRAMEMISEQRSIFGSFQNRFEHAKSNAENTAENTTAAESRIRDANLAKIMVQYSKYNILTQAGQSMLANANQSKQNVLDLLQP